jgi:hypothetical protein
VAAGGRICSYSTATSAGIAYAGALAAYRGEATEMEEATMQEAVAAQRTHRTDESWFLLKSSWNPSLKS